MGKNDVYCNTYRTTIIINAKFGDNTSVEAIPRGERIAEALLSYLPEEVRKELQISIKTHFDSPHGTVEKIKEKKEKFGVRVIKELEWTEVEPYIGLGTQAFLVEDKKYLVKMGSSRYRLFGANRTCVVCGLEGSIWRLEQDDNQYPNSATLSLYGIKEGRYIVMTKDHILAKSKGGKDHIDNYQTMCTHCNAFKGSEEITIEDLRKKMGINKVVKVVENPNKILPPTGVEIPLDSLMVSQGDLHHPDQLDSMIGFVRRGGYFRKNHLEKFAEKNDGRKNPPLIGITRFPDGSLMLHDGHHRAVSIKLGGRDYLHAEEYFIKEYQYSDYTEINFEQGWVTPFDPRKEIRSRDFKDYKIHVMELYATDPATALQYVADNPRLYRMDRDINNVSELASRIESRRQSILRSISYYAMSS